MKTPRIATPARISTQRHVVSRDLAIAQEALQDALWELSERPLVLAKVPRTN
jgi:hypothetical protein